ncbi:hypothetical protein OOK58_43325 [Streptomyces sp. NBC_01728]|uniref:hypothetical protein n=1 Tax=unclassified Streptomyces TaxID=2593676 RepID=UPI0022522F00|nr:MULTISPECIES: hypothetical protein [unclassified Streptomyces]MCX4458744.1 hypothetical protein [Streptomyces sp. NBC_01719]MCX4498101.1 hypothetical protein [Streptomyces sp. NBC_01728]
MLVETLQAVAAEGGIAVVAAAGTDAWEGIRGLVARLFHREEDPQGQVALERLDQTAAALEQAESAEAERIRSRQEISWQTRFEDLLEGLDEAGRTNVAGQLHELVELVRQQVEGGVSAGAGGLAVGGDLTIRAESGSVAGGVINGGAHVGNPLMPGPDQS